MAKSMEILRQVFFKQKSGDYEIRLAYDASDNLEYVGFAEPGSLASENKWFIRKLSYTGSNLTRIQLANDSSAANAEWDERATGGYF